MDEYYKILGLKPGASREEIQQAYKDLVNVWHPDRFSHDPHLQIKAQDELKKINEAYECLQRGISEPAPPATPPPETIRAASADAKMGVPTQRESAKLSQWLWPIIGLVVMGAFAAKLILQQEATTPPPAPNPFNSYKTEIEKEKTRLPPKPFVSDDTAETLSPEIIIARKKKEAERWGDTPGQSTGGSAASPGAQKLTYITVGSGKDDVTRIQGRPNSASSNLFTYGSSHIYFENGQVIGWENSSPRLKVRLYPTARSHASTFTIGSTKDEVLSVQGTPDSFTDNDFSYGNSTVHFKDGRVTDWFEHDVTLKARMQPGKE